MIAYGLPVAHITEDMDKLLRTVAQMNNYVQYDYLKKHRYVVLYVSKDNGINPAGYYIPPFKMETLTLPILQKLVLMQMTGGIDEEVPLLTSEEN